MSKILQFSEGEFSKYAPYDRGVLEVKLSGWEQFSDLVKKFTDRDYYWRGQRQNWPLLSSFDRRYGKVKRWGDPKRDLILTKHLIQYKENLKKPDWEDDDYWTYGQHQGLLTPFLDLTKCPYIAAYFAFEEKSQSESDFSFRYVYALHKSLKKWLGTNTSDSFRFQELIDNGVGVAEENKRLKAQKGAFFKSNDWKNIEQRVKSCYHNNGETRIVLCKIKIPSGQRSAVLTGLNKEDINAEKLFPDDYGHAKQSNMELELSNLLEDSEQKD